MTKICGKFSIIQKAVFITCSNSFEKRLKTFKKLSKHIFR